MIIESTQTARPAHGSRCPGPTRSGRASGFAIARTIIGLVFAVVALVGCTPQEPGGRSRPNVIWIVLDACRADRLSAYGYGRETTPRIDALAARGSLFERNYAQAPNTLPSVPSYLTGRHLPAMYQDPEHLGVWFQHRPPPGERLISEILSEHGYRTAAISASPWFSDTSRLAKGFDEFTWLRPDADERVVPSLRRINVDAMRWIDDHEDAPFFLYIHAMDTHSPHLAKASDSRWVLNEVPEERARELRWWDSREQLDDDETFSPEELRFVSAIYDGSLLRADAAVGELLDHLAELGIADDTIVIVSSDHGELVGDDGRTLGHPATGTVDELLETPLVIAGPGVPEGRRIEAATENADVVPTIMELVGATPSVELDGLSLVPLMRGRVDALPREFCFARTYKRSLMNEPTRVYVTDDEKRILKPGWKLERLAGRTSDAKRLVAYRLPDSARGRNRIEDATWQAAAAADDREHFGPRWALLQAQPEDVPDAFSVPVRLRDFLPRSVERRDLVEQGKWQRVRAHGEREGAQSGLVVARGVVGEVVRRATVRTRPGRYRVAFWSEVLPGAEVGTRFSVGLPEQGERVDVAIPSSGSSADGGRWIEVGELDVTGDELELELFVGEGGGDLVLGRFRFLAVDSEKAWDTPTLDAATAEQLRALGYGED